jgi:CelD/BcsL family acetyltransferase involved in cellulose biosynthesis
MLSEWDAPGFAVAPTAPDTGPFADRVFLETWWDLERATADQLLLAGNGTGLIPAMSRNGAVELIGDADVTDYHSPRGSDLFGAVAILATLVPPGTPFRFDSLPLEAALALTQALAASGIDATRVEHEVAAVLALPSSFDDYLAGIGKKERHETRRKRRRFEAEIGEPRLQRVAGPEAVRMFADMHRKASGDKGHFMTASMERFFAALHERAGAIIHVLSGADEVPVAAAFGFEDHAAYYLYNSAYDPEASHASPGVVLIAMLIESAIAAGHARFDFLKGDEAYKFRLGAEPRPLYALSGVLEGSP